MRTLRMSATLLVLLTATACASRGGDSGGSGPAGSSTGGAGENSGSTVSSGILPPPDTGPPTQPQPNKAVPDSRAVNLRPVRWSRADAGPGSQVRIQYTVGGLSQCSMLGRVDVAETATTVTVTVRVGQAPGASCDGPQPMIAATYETTVTLREPLGTRTVKDSVA